MDSNNRLEQIHELINHSQHITITQISEQFQVSTATARRDLDVLAQQGKIQRVHGGAVLIKKAPPELPVLQRCNEQSDEKVRIGAAAAELIRDGEIVFLGAGTTVLEVANHLRDRHNLTIITDSLLVENALAGRQDIDLIIMGGMFRSTEYTVYGHLTEQDICQVNADKVIFGIRAISLEQGLMNDFFPEISTDRAILKTGREVIIVADHTKFNRISTASVCPITNIHAVVTDDQTPQDTLNAIREMGIRVVVA